MLALKGVFLQFGAFMKGIAHAPVKQRLHRPLPGVPAGVGTCGKAPVRRQSSCFADVGRGPEKMVGRILQTPEDAFAHGLPHQLAQTGVGHGTVVLETPRLFGQNEKDLTVVAHKVAHKGFSPCRNPAIAHARSSRSSTRATSTS